VTSSGTADPSVPASPTVKPTGTPTASPATDGAGEASKQPVPGAVGDPPGHADKVKDKDKRP
jgi:hypothetical protein